MDWNIPSSIEGIIWPPLPGSAAATRLAALFQLEQTQWWPEEKLRAYQSKQLQPLLKYSKANVPYYRETLPDIPTDRPLTDEEWLAIPLLTRDTIQQRGEELRTVNLPTQHGRVTRQFTSGSTGKPVEVLGTDITGFFWNVVTLREHLWHKRDFSANLAVIRRIPNDSANYPHGMDSVNWGRATHGIIETGSSAMLSIFTPVHEMAEWLIRKQPQYLLTNPSVLQDLAIYFRQNNLSLPSLQQVRTLSETLPEGLRELCMETWGAALVDVYSSIELGYLALQCPENKHYHIQSESVLVEVLDDSGKPCRPGESGRVVITNLHNYATPLIRYELGDIVEVGEPCSCGRGLPVIKKIRGRYRGMVTLPTGDRSWPDLGIVKLNKIAPVQQFQVVQHSLENIEAKLVLPRPLSDEEKQRYVELLQQTLRYPFNIEIKQIDSIPRSKGGKYEEFISLL